MSIENEVSLQPSVIKVKYKLLPFVNCEMEEISTLITKHKWLRKDVNDKCVPWSINELWRTEHQRFIWWSYISIVMAYLCNIYILDGLLHDGGRFEKEYYTMMTFFGSLLLCNEYLCK